MRQTTQLPPRGHGKLCTRVPIQATGPPSPTGTHPGDMTTYPHIPTSPQIPSLAPGCAVPTQTKLLFSVGFWLYNPRKQERDPSRCFFKIIPPTVYMRQC